MNTDLSQLLVFTDVDGCLLNKSDYDYTAALPAVKRLQKLNIPIILSSSKTASELTLLAEELDLCRAPLSCENGGQILWNGHADTTDSVFGMHRTEILEILDELKHRFRFRSFADLGLKGVMAATDLPADKAGRAMERASTEPLLWDDSPECITEFQLALSSEGLTLTQGGRFWHVAGSATKGNALSVIAQQYSRHQGQPFWTVAIGDSPIDQSMLDVADVPIGIPAPDGNLNVDLSKPGSIRSSHAGAIGWAEAIGALLDRADSAV